jgi:hypothetical protein
MTVATKTTNVFNALQLIKEKKQKEEKLHKAQLCMAGHCEVSKK